MVQQAVQQAMMGGGGGMGGGMGGGNGGAGGMKPPKPDINMVATDVFQMKKLMFAFFRQMGWEPPPDILDGPGRHPATGAPASGPMGGSDPAMTPDNLAPGPGGGPGGTGGAGGPSGAPGGSAIPAMPPMDAASPALAQQPKMASWQEAQQYNETLYKYAGYDLDQIHLMLKQAEATLLRLTGDDPRIGEVVTGNKVVKKAAALAMRLQQRHKEQQPA
jgi:hypothetical protein